MNIRKKSLINMIVMLMFIMIIISTTGCDNKNIAKKSDSTDSNKSETLLVYSGAGLRKAMDEVGEKFKEKYDVQIQYTYGGSAQILSQIELSGKGDIFIPGSMAYYDKAKEKKLVDENMDVAYHIPVIAVPKGNEKDIKNIEDLAKEGVKVVLGDPNAPAIGKVSKKMLSKLEIYDQIVENLVASTATVNELVVYISMKQADASIIWEDNVKNVEDIDIINIPEEKNMIKTIPISVIKNSNKQDLSKKFVEFVVSEEGKEIFEKHGFKTVK